VAAVTGRKFFEELGQLVGKPVVVEDSQGKSYEGNLLGFDSQSMSIALGEVKGSQGTLYHRLILTGNVVAKIMATDTPSRRGLSVCSQTWCSSYQRRGCSSS